jgi:hypothetical protein
MVLGFFPSEAQAANARQHPALVQKEIYLLITEDKCHFHISLFSMYLGCIFCVSHDVMKEIIIFLNDVRACALLQVVS